MYGYLIDSGAFAGDSVLTLSKTATLPLADLSSATSRVEQLRAIAIDRIPHVTGEDREVTLLAARSWWTSSGEASVILRRGMLAGDILRGMTPVIDTDELLVGKFSRRELTSDESTDIENWRKYGEPATGKAFGQRAHMSIDYDRVLRLGIRGVITQIERYRSSLDTSRAADLEKDCFYRACLSALDGVIVLATKYADLADEQARDAAPERIAELTEIARVCRNVPEYPAETFAEAMQAVHFITFAMCAGNRMLLFQPGRPDRYLLPYFRRDMASGRLTREKALELIDCFGILLNEYTPRGLAVGWMVGGRDSSGVDISNELSELFVETIGHVRMAYPAVGVCWTPDTPRDLMRLASRLLARGYSHPALFNDDVITRGLMGLGLSHRDACEYIHSCCVEITPIAISNVYVASPYFNLIQCLHDVLGIPQRGIEPIAMPDIPSMDDLLGRFNARLHDIVHAGIADQNRCMMSRAQSGGFPLLSCFVNDCLADGKDIDHGGARVNWIECSFVGLANLVDALAAIRLLVFEQRRISLSQLRDALIANFDGHADIKALLDKAPKYGTDNDTVDALVQPITDALRQECEQYRSYWGGAFVPGFFCWQMHEHLGRHTMASADGRAEGFPFADGSGPAQGREMFGPTAAVLSSTKWNHEPMIGGVAVNMRFQPGNQPDDIVEPLSAVCETFLRLGGFETQINVVNTSTLRDAQAHPDRYRDLVVRVAGYSDYFVGLSAEMQAEVIMRSEMTL
ncbi:MAG TPA: pyruvate formate lyase family protein [Capsulimonadaceae bacterium]|jgi:formate C-acetyltransferase